MPPSLGKDRKLILAHHTGIIHYGRKRFAALKEGLESLKKDDEGYKMGALYMLESMAFMYYALNADTMTRAEIYKDLVKIIRDTEESGILEQAAAEYKRSIQ